MTMDRQAGFLWMKDLLEHLGQCCDQWQAADPPAERFLADAMRRDLDELRRVCDALAANRSNSAARRLAIA